MSEMVPGHILDALQVAQRRRRRGLRAATGKSYVRILRAWDGGFAIDAAQAPRLRGRVDLYDGSRHVAQCLVVAVGEENGERLYEYKRVSSVLDSPPRDYAPETSPAKLLPRL